MRTAREGRFVVLIGEPLTQPHTYINLALAYVDAFGEEAGGDVELTATEARQLAAELLQLADEIAAKHAGEARDLLRPYSRYQGEQGHESSTIPDYVGRAVPEIHSPALPKRGRFGY